MCSLFSFLAYSEERNRVLKSIEGVIMYPYTETNVPNYVYFMPKKLNEGERLGAFFKQQFLYLPDEFYVLYFNPIRWILPDLASIMKSLNSIPVGYGKNQLLFELSYGRITFDVTPNSNQQEETDKTVFHVPIYLEQNSFFINVVELPLDMGTPKLFEKIDFLW